jgi:ubiquinone/menaquinone biosynthesis C-methylase UbiE
MIEADEIKSCCAMLYSNDLVRLLVGDSLHPGGLELTQHIGARMALCADRKLLDIACGPGTSAIRLAREFGCAVTGLDYAKRSIAAAQHSAIAAGLAERTQFVCGDAEHLPLPDSSVDAAICECSFCTFPNKLAAAREVFRVLAPGGRFALSDLVRTGPVPSELQSLFAWAGCIAGAQPLEDYRSLLEQSNFEVELVEHHDALLRTLVDNIRRRLVGAQVASGLGRLGLAGIDLDSATAIARSAADAVRDGRLGYVLIVATKASTESR